MAPGSQIPTTPTHSHTPFPFSLRPTPYHDRIVMASTSKKTCDISNLMSPPEPPKLQSFAHMANGNNGNSMQKMSMSVGPIMFHPQRRLSSIVPPLSPPISPATKHDDHVMNGVATSTKDPILYPVHDVASPPAQQPLFVSEDMTDESTDARRIVDDHVSARPAQLFRESSPPNEEDYQLVLAFKSQVMKKYQENRKAWLQRERDQLILDRRAQAQHRQFKLQRILPAAHPQPVRKEAQRVKPARAPKVTKPKPAAAAKPTPTKPRPIRAGPGPSTATAGSTKSIARVPSSTPDPTPRRPTQNRADDDFDSIDDLCPPLSSLDSKPGIISSLKVEWKTGVTDLSKDPHRHLLHAEELQLASSLRLTCAVYLTSKRRIFCGRRQCIGGKEFRKTDAQQACKIDVNKASKLWTAYNAIGWLDPKWMEGKPMPVRF